MSLFARCPCASDSPADLNVGEDDLVEASCDPDVVPVVPRLEKIEEEPKEEKKDAPPDAKPDFSGHWVQVAVEGDFDAYLKSMGMGYVSRTLAKSMGYGVKKVQQVVEHEGEKFKMTLTNPKGTKVFDLLINSAEQDSVDPVEDKPIKVQLYWDKTSLVMSSRSEKPPKELGKTRRYLRDQDTIVELESPDGVRAKRVFSKAKT
ncbi:unnamed protein product [Durusdinium trenchii]|uniref:Uncharacterized protein n=3 Tax=Durusdinium trenchii TaxID=1381693 RepID=A0ABP0LIW3_9DINO